MPANKQHRLFDEPDPAPWDADDEGSQWIASIVSPNGPPRELDYCVPAQFQGRVAPGQRLKVPLGRGDREIIAYCVKLEHRAAGPRKLKEVTGLIDEQSLLSPSMMRLTMWIAEHYLCPLAQVLEAVLPAGVRGQAGTRLTTFLSVPAEVAPQLAEMKLPVKQLAVLRYLAASPVGLTPQQLANGAQCGPGPITALRRKGLIASVARRVQSTDRTAEAHCPEANLILNADQQAALDTILSALQGKRHETILLHGVTGSGKTEVYIRAIQEVVSYGRQAIVLVPEISLTPQAQQRFKARFGQVAVLHSHLTDAERHYQWQRIARGETPVVVGARSAIFSPTPHLGLIVLDEEHEGTFKQDTAPRYHARDVALERAKAESVPLVLGSATPSLESWLRAQRGEYRLVTMPTRVADRPMPSVMTIDLRNESRDRVAGGALSRPMQMAMKEALEDNGQVILLLNRRGYSTHIQCPACGEVLRCPHCDIALTHHRQAHIVLCHYCEHEVPPPQKCPACDFAGINYGGVGTQRLEAEVRARFPDHRCLRMDTDSMQGPGSHERALESFRSGQAQILLGTQMIAKGLDFPNVTLVGVVNSDTALHLPDFRAAERTFQLLVQVAGRTGRGPRGGRVLVQSLNPDHPAIKAAVRHDYRAFAEQELPLRESLSYPPFASMARLVMRGESQATTRAFADELAGKLTEALARHEAAARVLGPAPAPIAKLRGRYRFQIQVQSPHAERLRLAVSEATQDIKPPDDVQWIVDIDPLDML